MQKTGFSHSLPVNPTKNAFIVFGGNRLEGRFAKHVLYCYKKKVFKAQNYLGYRFQLGQSFFREFALLKLLICATKKGWLQKALTIDAWHHVGRDMIIFQSYLSRMCQNLHFSTHHYLFVFLKAPFHPL